VCASQPSVVPCPFCVQIDLMYNNLQVEGGKAIAEAIVFSPSLTECTLLENEFDGETATMLAKISKDKQISLCGITPDQTEADFKDHGLQPADAILIAAALEFRGSLTSANLLGNEFDVKTATKLAQISKEKQLTLCSITPDQTEADFKHWDLRPADAILIAASLEFRGSLTQVREGAHFVSATLPTFASLRVTFHALHRSTLREI
jgi:hypothetical protein